MAVFHLNRKRTSSSNKSWNGGGRTGILTLLTCAPGQSALKNRPSKIRAPLSARPFTKKRAACTPLNLVAANQDPARSNFNLNHPHENHLSSAPTSPLHLYVGENFSVRLHKGFKLRRILNSDSENGVIRNEFDRFRSIEQMRLSDAARKILEVPNAGGNSVVSEVLSFELLKRCYGADLIKTEMEVSYFPEGGSITDYVCQLYDLTIGVSVTRAMNYRAPFSTEDARRLLTKKLNGVVQSSKNTLENWTKQILHVWVQTPEDASVLMNAYNDVIDAQTKSNTLVLVTVAANAPEVFYNR